MMDEKDMRARNDVSSVETAAAVGVIKSVELHENCLEYQWWKSHRPGVKEETGWWWFSHWCRNGEVHSAGSLHSATPASPWPSGNLLSLLWWFHESPCDVCKSKGIKENNKHKHTKLSEMYYVELICHKHRDWDLYDLCSKDKVMETACYFFSYTPISQSRLHNKSFTVINKNHIKHVHKWNEIKCYEKAKN